MSINADQRRVVVDKLASELGGQEQLRGKRIAVLGLAFKDNTDDMRDAPAIDIVNWLIEAGAEVRTFDPVAMETAQRIFPDWQVTYCTDEYDAVTGCEGVLVVTEWKQFRHLNLTRLRGVMSKSASDPVFIDGRNLFDAAEVSLIGFRYHGIGRGNGKRNGLNGHSTAGQGAASSERTTVAHGDHAGHSQR
jgi:UDPglucose 6-dehydrogenase